MREIYVAAKNRIEERIARAKHQKEIRKEQIKESIPRVTVIEEEIFKAGIELSKVVVLENSEELVFELKNKLNALQEEKIKLIEDSGFPKNYLDDVYICDICNDSGYIDEEGRTVKCSCHKQYIIDEIYNKSSIPYDVNQTFETFDINLFEGDSKRKIEHVKSESMKFINNFDDVSQKNLIFMGGSGTGKTFLTNCIATEIMRKGKTVLYQTAPDMFNNINRLKMQSFNDNDNSGYEFYEYLMKVDLLVIDDLGTESKTASRYAELFTIINNRLVNNNKMIISTNLAINDITDNYDERILSRFIGDFEIFNFDWKDIRIILSMKG